MTKHRLLAVKGWGSALVEAAAAVAGIELEIEEIDAKGTGRDRLLKLNPLGQVPTLLLPDGSVMTESAAILLYIADLKPGSGLAPAPADPERARFLRWLVFLVAEIYAAFAFSDEPSHWVDGEAAAAEFRRRINAHRQRLWQIVEGEIRPNPWFLGTRFSALDIYVAVMTRWTPRREWFAQNCPKLTQIALAADAHPKLSPVILRNFG
ncbi:MAG: glutathione S-transferase family protein [Proteobacteria bacterium]|nr:glutathione S-transferase family protein [Pseudomonadota bacterium]MBI3498372.1 glutathione S-transferase family protein [Pseudomonadota bacterium]